MVLVSADTAKQVTAPGGEKELKIDQRRRGTQPRRSIIECTCTCVFGYTLQLCECGRIPDMQLTAL